MEVNTYRRTLRSPVTVRLCRPIGQQTPVFEPDRWPGFIDYACVLQRTGAPEHAEKLIAEAMALLETFLMSGVVATGVGNVEFTMAELHALNGQPQQAMAALRRAAPQGGLTRDGLWWLRELPQFDSLRGDPAFTSLVAEQEAKSAAQRQRLADQNLLLTPQQVLQAEGFSYEPFP